MWWLLQAFYGFLYNSALEFVFFILVDVVAKSPLKEAKTEGEKKKIWFYESMFLGCLALLIYCLDHTPYLLLVLTLLTLIYTQLNSHIDFRHWYLMMRTRWEEHQHHTENVKFMNEQLKMIDYCKRIRKQNSPPQASKPVLKRLSDLVFRNKAEKENTGPSTPLSAFPMNASVNTTDALNKSSSIPSFQPSSTAMLQQQMPAQPILQSNIPATSAYNYSPTPNKPLLNTNFATASSSNNWFTRNDLKRRPLRTYAPQDPSLHQPTQNSFTGTSRNIRNRFMSAFGFNGISDKPAGLRNEGQNLCFMNCVIQCLSRSPGLVKKLVTETKNDIDCSVAESTMVSTFAELMKQCSNPSSGVLDPTAFRQSVAILHDGLVAPPTERQHQQDAAEFFMWLMETLHNILNKKAADGPVESESCSSLKMLKFIYGDLKPTKIRDLKLACRKEISEANGLQNESYAEPIQRLSDLEWLTYKQDNVSVVDNMFTGQLVEAYHCLTDNHLTVNTQTFSILPVPVVSPRDVSGLVFLEDCFTKFCNVEHLTGKEGLECSFCNTNSVVQNQHTPHLLGNSHRNSKTRLNSHRSVASSVDSALHSPSTSTPYIMSPIPALPGQRESINDSGFHDNVFRTSTPVGEQQQQQLRFPFPPQQLRDAQRRCLLRQLPDCLVIQLLRFTYNQFSQQSRKINAPVSIPLKGLDMTNIVYDNVTNREDLTAEQKSQRYDLYAVCVHLGAESTSYGHYVCYCQAQDGVWYKFDDELVWDVNMEYEITTREIRENAYLLFYKRSQDTQNTQTR